MRSVLFILLFLQMMLSVPVFGQTESVETLQTQLKDAKLQAKQLKRQQDSLSLCLKEARYYTNDKQAFNFDKARNFLKLAFANPLGKDNVEVWLQAANTEYQCYQTERNKPASGKKIDDKVIFNSTATGFEYYNKAYDMLMHSPQSVSAKKMLQIRANAYELFRATQGFRATAGYYYNKKEWVNAYKYFRMGLDALDSQLLKDFARYNGAPAADLARFDNDSLRTRLLFSCAVTAVKTGDHTTAIRELEAVKLKAVEINHIYQQLALEYDAIDDMEGYERTLREASVQLPDEIWYPRNLLNLYLSRHDIAKSLSVVDDVIRIAPVDAAPDYELKGRLLEEMGDATGAEESYLKALVLDPNLLLANLNLGRLYFNVAVAAEEQYIEARKFDSIYEEVVPQYEKALPYYLKAYEVDQQRKETAIATAVRTILYKRFQNPRCKEARQLISQYNEVSKAYGLPTL